MLKQISILIISSFLAIITVACDGSQSSSDVKMEECLQLPGAPLPDNCKKS
jgi:hypothetical protein